MVKYLRVITTNIENYECNIANMNVITTHDVNAMDGLKTGYNI